MAITLDANLGTFVQASASGTVSLTTTNAVSAGAFIVIGIVGFESSAVTVTVTGGGLSWTTDKEGRPPGGGGNPVAEFVAIASAQAPSGLAASTVLTATFSVSTVQARIIGGTSFTGVKTSSPVDGTPIGPTFTDTQVTPWATASYAMAAGSLLYTVCFSEHTDTGSTPTSPSVEAWQTQDLANDYGAAANYRIESSAGSYTSEGTWGGITKWTNVAVAYLAATEGTTDTFAITSNSNDGDIYAPNSAGWATLIASGGEFYNPDNFGSSGALAGKGEFESGNYYGIENALFRFDTSSLPDDCTITSASLKLYVVSLGGANDISYAADYYDYGGSPAVQADWETFSSGNAIASFTEVSLTVSTVNTIALTSLSGINKSGFTGIRIAPLNTTQPTDDNWVEFATYESAFQEPRLEVTYTTEEPTIEYHLDAHNVTPMRWR